MIILIDLFFFLTLIAHSVKLDPVTGDGKGCDRGDTLVQSLVKRNCKIDDRTAPFADKVIMPVYIRVKTIKGTPEVYFLHETLPDKDIEITVDRSQTKVWKFVFKTAVQPVRRRVRCRRPEQGENFVPLSASLEIFILFYRSTLIMVIIGIILKVIYFIKIVKE